LLKLPVVDATLIEWRLVETLRNGYGKIHAKISIGMPVYNGEPYLEEAIQSVLSQTYEDFVLIISDNASIDRTEQICRNYASQDHRVVYTRNRENIGAAKNYNRVFEMSSGPYFRWFNADDVCAPKLLQRCVEVMDARSDVVLCYGKTDIIDFDGRLIKHYDDNLDLQQETAGDRFVNFLKAVGLNNAIYGLMRSAAVGKTMLMGNGSYPAADINFLAEMTLYGKFMEIPEVLFFRRMHSQASSSNLRDTIFERVFWTGKANPKGLSLWRKELTFLKGIYGSPIDVYKKIWLSIYIIHRLAWMGEKRWSEIRKGIRRKCRREEE
jgi:glycosyltransferase involved in cell wall biosynthesis